MHYVCAHTPVTLCTIEGIGKKNQREKRENYTAVVRCGWTKSHFSNCECVACGSTVLDRKVAGSFFCVCVVFVCFFVFCLFLFSKLLLFAAGTHQLYLHPPFPTIAEKRKKAFNYYKLACFHISYLHVYFLCNLSSPAPLPSSSSLCAFNLLHRNSKAKKWRGKKCQWVTCPRMNSHM